MSEWREWCKRTALAYDEIAEDAQRQVESKEYWATAKNSYFCPEMVSAIARFKAALWRAVGGPA